MTLPLIPLFLVRDVRASDGLIGWIATVQAAAQFAGYVIWPRTSARWGRRAVLLLVAPVVALYPAALSITTSPIPVLAITAVAACFTAGVDLVIFDEMMRTVPESDAGPFVSVHVTVGNAAAIVAPLIAAAVVSARGVDTALRAATVVALVGAGLLIFHAWQTRTSGPGLGRRATAVAES